METRLIELVNSFESAENVNSIARESLDFLKTAAGSGECQGHSRLCSAMLKRAEGGNADVCNLLHFAGQSQVLNIIYSNIVHTKLPTAKWLANEVRKLLQNEDGLTSILVSNSINSDPNQLSPLQEHLVGVVCRLPDVLANRLGRQLKADLLPMAYFKRLGECLVGCLQHLYEKFEGMKTDSSEGAAGCSLLFASAVLGKAATLGHHDVIIEPLLSFLERRVVTDISWEKMSQRLFSGLPPVSLEPVLQSLANKTSPSLLPPSPFHSLIGRDILNDHRVKFILTHKLILIRIPQSPNAVYNLLGYLATSKASREMMGQSLQSALEVWSDGTSLRHMDTRQHLWISRVIVLGVTLLEGHAGFDKVKQSLLKLIMTGIQVHVQSPLAEVRHIGMAVGECLMNKLHKTSAKKKTKDSGEKEKEEENELKFDYEPNPETESIKKLARPLDEQEKDLKRELETTELHDKMKSVNKTRESRSIDEISRDRHLDAASSKVLEDERHASPQRFGEGYVHAVECSDSDSDDDLVPYPMDDDPDVSQLPPPRYLRNLIKDLLSSKEPQKMEVALCSAESLIRSQPYDLSEVCEELAKVLLHLSDNFAFDDFSARRHGAMVALAVLCPEQVTPYLTREFYAPNYTLRHRMDILEVISSAALELSTPQPSSSENDHQMPPPSSLPGVVGTRKPWQDIINQRLKSKTRVISKGPSKPLPKAIPNRFTTVAPLFFFPLMNRFDHQVNTLDLLGEDSLVLGNLLYTLGTVMYAATHLPLVSAMAVALLNFLWSLRYHSDTYVRQGVLYGLGMMLWASPAHTLLELGAGLTETVAWMKEVSSQDADEQCRTLAVYALGMLNETLKK